LLALGLYSLPIEALPVPFVGFQAGDQLGIDAPCYAFGRDSAPSPNGWVQEGSAIAIDERHCTTRRAPFPKCSRLKSKLSFRSCSSSLKSAKV
jgi:hypothetical protein